MYYVNDEIPLWLSPFSVPPPTCEADCTFKSPSLWMQSPSPWGHCLLHFILPSWLPYFLAVTDASRPLQCNTATYLFMDVRQERIKVGGVVCSLLWHQVPLTIDCFQVQTAADQLELVVMWWFMTITDELSAVMWHRVAHMTRKDRGNNWSLSDVSTSWCWVHLLQQAHWYLRLPDFQIARVSAVNEP